MPTSRVNGIRLYWETAGEAGDPMVLVHGSWGDHQNWSSVVPGLSQSFRVLTYDRRGHSRSQRPEGQGNVGEDVADLAALLDELGHCPAHIAGNSFGASIVLRLAAARPDLFRSVIVHEPPLFGLLSAEPGATAALAAVQERMSAVVSLLALVTRWAAPDSSSKRLRSDLARGRNLRKKQGTLLCSTRRHGWTKSAIRRQWTFNSAASTDLPHQFC